LTPLISPRRLLACALLVCSLPAINGCTWLLVSKRKLPVPVAPTIVQTVTGEELVGRLNSQWIQFESMTAKVDIQASHLQSSQGEATDYPTFRSVVLLRKPGMLRIRGLAPVVQSVLFDLGSNGTSFTLMVPPKSKAYTGLNAGGGKSTTWYENLRPGFLFDAMIVRGLRPDELYSVTAETVTEEDPAKKHLIARPEYVVSIMRRKADTQQLAPVRVIRFHREDLLPYEQDLYDGNGALETQVTYSSYLDFNGVHYPGSITLKRPQDEYQLVIAVETVSTNIPLKDSQFEVNVPEGTPVQKLD
jgi:outer membrane lipoprotein-sorting protein